MPSVARAPRVADIVWRDRAAPTAPKVTLVGKGVYFDTGGLDLKTASGMLLMKRIWREQRSCSALPKRSWMRRCRCASGAAAPRRKRRFRQRRAPVDIVHARKALTVEIGNTETEAQLILCEALICCSDRFIRLTKSQRRVLADPTVSAPS
jgi:leucyl aminopeptidase